MRVQRLSHPCESIYCLRVCSETSPMLDTKYPSVQKVLSFQKMPPEKSLMLFPDEDCRLLLETSHDLNRCNGGVGVHPQMNMVQVHLHSFDAKPGVYPLCNFFQFPLDILSRVDEKWFSVFHNEDNVIEDAELSMAFCEIHRICLNCQVVLPISERTA